MVSPASTFSPQAGPDPCALLTSTEVMAAVGAGVTSSGVDLPSGIGGRQCLWTAPDGRAVAIETRVDADLDPTLVAAGESAVSVLDESIATQLDRVTRVPGLGIEAFAGDGHVYVAAPAGTLVLDDQAGLDPATEISLARSATARL